MARVTVEDCITKIPNRFQLVLTATHRARQLSNGAEPQVAPENDKPTVIALREIAQGYVKSTAADAHTEVNEAEDAVAQEAAKGDEQ